VKTDNENTQLPDASMGAKAEDVREIYIVEHRVYDRQGSLAGQTIDMRNPLGDFRQDVPGVDVPHVPRLRDIFNIHFLTTGWNAMMTASVLLTGTVPSIAQNFSSFDVSDWPRGVIVGLGLLFTASSGIEWIRGIGKSSRHLGVPSIF